MKLPLLLLLSLLTTALLGTRSAHAQLCSTQPLAGGPVLNADTEQRGDVLYVAGGKVQFDLFESQCLGFEGAFWNNVKLGAPGTIDPKPGLLITNMLFTADGLRRWRVTITFPSAGQGAPHKLELKGGGAVLTFQVVDVADLNGPFEYRLSTAQLSNMVMTSVATQWMNGSMKRGIVSVREPDWGSFSFTTSEGGIHVHLDTIADLSSTPCEIAVSVDVDVQIDLFRGEVTATSIDPRVQLELRSGWCDLVYLHPDVFTLVQFAFAAATEVVTAEIHDEVGDAIAEIEIDCAPFCFLVELALDPQGLKVSGGKLGALSIQVKVPYSAGGLTDPLVRMPVPAGSEVVIVAGGLVKTCASETGDPATCAAIEIGPKGIYDMWTNFPGIDGGILYSGATNGAGKMVYDAYTANRWNAATKALREENVGALVATMGGPTLLADEPCSMGFAGAGARLGLGVNDTIRNSPGSWGRGAYVVTVVFDQPYIAPCRSARLPLSGKLRKGWALNWAEIGALGFSTGPITAISDGGSQVDFHHGLQTLYFSPRLDVANYVQGAIKDRWLALGGPTSWFGYPLSPELRAPSGGRYSRFERATIYWRGGFPVFVVQGGIRDRHEQLGGVHGFLGYPLSDEQWTANQLGRVSHFEGGSVYWTATVGSHAVRKSLHDYYLLQGGAGVLGHPTASEVTSGSWTWQTFERGTIYRYMNGAYFR